jgi:hypothetical protein
MMVKMFHDPSSKAIDLIVIAKSNLSLARGGRVSEDTRYEELCTLCQQAVEKSFKALITHHNIPYPADHSIENLIHYCEEKKIAIPTEIKSTSALLVTYEGGFSLPLTTPISFGKAVSLSEYAGNRRYSVSEQPLNEQNYIEILKRTEKIVGWIEKQVII